ncbi:DUF1652 domain-containing protein [Pseudomonas aegrilactucae]|uniref:DUF1652 domain-containing protein n=1 Tax=Pseudomonas aegrilactucae TaxID=2854028 RepID=A0A9Q2XG96_9PSED|nr:DUF1652 domain-containing protein [Pseudomonas aegrilactucae]MBV6286153.1 DUF1652 domain-containing protein [Pseudomonas aegrilactucae]
MLSTLELSNIIESRFLPVRCRCTQASDHSLTVQLYDSRFQRIDLQVTGISAAQLNSNRAITNLVSGLRRDLIDKQTALARQAHDSL